MTRREAIHNLGAGLVTLAASAEAAPGPLTAKHVTAPDWYWQPMRWLTMNLTHDDVGQFDPDFWLDYLKRCHVDAASWNSGGIVAVYPTKIPFHKRAEKLGTGDPLGYLIEGCRRMGLIVTTRVDHHATYPETARAHPEWISTSAKGELQRHWAEPNLYLTCTLGPYNEVFMTDVMRELVTMYRVDGFNHNRWAPQVMCYCAWCRENFRKASGREPPAREDPSDPSWAAYLVWRENRIFELWDTWNAAIRKVNPNAFVLPGIGGESGKLDMSKVRARAKTLYLDYQGRSGLNAPWMAGKRGKEMRSVLGFNPPGLTFSTGISDENRWKDSVQSDAELRIWVHDGAAHGLRPKMAKFAGAVHDKRWLKPVEEIYTFLWKSEPYLRNIGYPIASAGFVHSQQTALFYTAPEKRGHAAEDSSRGMYQALIEARIANDAVHENLLAESDLDRFRVLILPNVACLSDKQCEQIRAYVKRGGSLVATHESSLYDEKGTRRSDFGLGDLFGVKASGAAEGPIRNSYMRFNRGKSHPVLDGFDGAGWMINGIFRQPVTPVAAFPDAPILRVAPFPDLPMEEVYPRDMDKSAPDVFLREIGKSRIVYVPSDLDRTFWSVLAPDHGRLLANLIRWAAHDDFPVEVEGKGILDVTAWRQKDSLAVHLVNLTNPMLMKGPFREIYPVGEQRVRLRLPKGVRPKKVKLLAAGAEAAFQTSGDWLTTAVPRVEVHEIVAVDI
jgi:hypothetical protein